MSLLEDLDHLRIPFVDIKSATNNFAHHNFLGQGGFGSVYKGQLPSSTRSYGPREAVAVKRLDVQGGQGAHEFLMEIVMLASYKHHNLVSLVGFSDEGNEKVLVYKQEMNGSLDNHLSSTNLSWEQRLRICLGAARGLAYLHGGVGEGHRVLHRDIKSSNVLLDAKWQAKISDFGLSKIGPTNQQFTFLVTNACGTFGYVDPEYVNTGILTKESDVYSFGVVLFEVLCGRPATIMAYEDERKFLSRLVKLKRKKGTLHEIIMPSLLEQADERSLQVFSDIAFQCLDENRKQRPTMHLIIKDLKTALTHQLGKRRRIMYPVPEPQKGTQTTLWGSAYGGQPFTFQLKNNQRLIKITIFHERWIHSLIFTFQDSDGSVYSSRQYGGLYHSGWDVMADVIYLDADEEIIGMSGSMGAHVNLFLMSSLSFTTNKKTHGPFGWEYPPVDKDTYFSGSWDLGSFEGFYGRVGHYVDALGCCLKTIT